MRELAFYEGRIHDPDEPVVRVGDRAHQFGDGVYEAWMVHRGRHVLRAEHLDRFERSAAALGLVPWATRAHLEAWSDALVAESGIENGMLYFQWSRGWQQPRNHLPSPGLVPVISGFIKAGVPGGDQTPLKVTLQPDERHLFCHIKTLNLLGSVRAIIEAHRRGCDDALLVRRIEGRDLVTEGTRSNAFAVKDGVVYTAPLGPWLLAGITRARVLTLATAAGVRVVEAFQTPEFFAAADEVFYTSCTAFNPVVSLDGSPVGKGQPGPITTLLLSAYQAFLDDVSAVPTRV